MAYFRESSFPSDFFSRSSLRSAMTASDSADGPFIERDDYGTTSHFVVRFLNWYDALNDPTASAFEWCFLISIFRKKAPLRFSDPKQQISGAAFAFYQEGPENLNEPHLKATYSANWQQLLGMAYMMAGSFRRRGCNDESCNIRNRLRLHVETWEKAREGKFNPRNGGCHKVLVKFTASWYLLQIRKQILLRNLHSSLCLCYWIKGTLKV